MMQEFLSDLQDPEEIQPPLVFDTLNDWVRDWLRFAYARRISGRNAPFWAAEWWKNQEAMMRLEVLWRTWEKLRQDPASGMHDWWKDHADHHMKILMSEDGPFRDCNDSNGVTRVLPHTEPPPGMFALTDTKLLQFAEADNQNQ